MENATQEKCDLEKLALETNNNNSTSLSISDLRLNCRTVSPQTRVHKLKLSKFCKISLRFIQSLFEILLGNSLFIVAIPLLLIVFSILLLIRAIVSLYLRKKYGTRYKLLKGRDAAWAYQRYAHDNCFYSFYKIQGICDMQKVRSQITTRVINHLINGKSTYSRLSRKITVKCGFYCWDCDHEFRIENHIVFLSSENEPLTENQVLARLSTVMDEPLDPNFPQWRVYIVPNLVCPNSSVFTTDTPKRYHYALVWRMNHAVMDGVSAANALQYCIADAPVNLSVDPLAPVKVPFYFNTCIGIQAMIFGARSFFKSMFWGDTNPFHGPQLTGPKYVGLSRPMNVEALKMLKNSTNTSVTAVMTSCVGKGLRTLGVAKGNMIPRSVSAGATYALLPYPSMRPQNRFTVAHMELKIGLEDSIKRLKHTFKSSEELCGSADLVKNFHMIGMTGLFPAVMVGKLMDRCHATVLLSNLPGPVEHYDIFEGDKLVGISGWNTIKGTTGITFLKPF